MCIVFSWSENGTHPNLLCLFPTGFYDCTSELNSPTLGICYQVKDGDHFYFKDGNVLWFKREADIDSDFFHHCFQSDFIQKQITDQAAVTTVGTYTIQNAKKTKLYCPPTLEEQRKVAAVLNSTDQEIETLQSQLDGLKQEKKALMQALLTGKRRVPLDA